MSNRTYISFYLRSNSIHIFCKAVREIGAPQFIRFLVNAEEMQMVMQAYDKKEFVSFRVPHAVYEKRGSMNVRSKKFCRLLATKLNWDVNESYRIPGVIYPSQNIVHFDLSKAALIENKNRWTENGTRAAE